MKKISYIFIILLFFCCKQEEKIPPELKIGFAYIEQHWKEDIPKIKSIAEEKLNFPRNIDYGIIGDMKRNLLQNHEQSETLIKFFNSIGITEYDDMVGIILISYHKFLNEKDINLDEQIALSNAYWQPRLACMKKNETRRLEIFTKNKIRDTINIRMPLSEYHSVVDYMCPSLDWEPAAIKHLSINGVITEKYCIRDSTDLYLKVKVLSKNYPQAQILYNRVNVGDEFEISLYETAWKINHWKPQSLKVFQSKNGY